MESKNKILLLKIVGYICKIKNYVGGLDKVGFLSDLKLVEACVFNLLQMGELANRVSADFQNQYTNVPWHKIRGLRNRLVHDYEGVNFELVWDIIDDDLDTLRKQLHDIAGDI